MRTSSFQPALSRSTARGADIATERPLGVLHVITGLGVGGAEGTLVNLATAERNPHRPLAVAALVGDGPHRARLDAAGVPVVDLGMRRGRIDPRAALRLARLIRATRPALVQGWMYHADLLCMAALSLSGQRAATRLVWSIRCSDMDAGRYGLLFRVARRAWTSLAGRADAVIANSEAGVAAHRDMGCRPRALYRVDNGVDTARFRPDPQARAEVRRSFGLSEHEPVVAIVGRVDPMKDHGLFLRVMDRLDGVKALAIGLGAESLPSRPNLLRLGRRDDVPRLLAASDLLMSTSRFGEGFPNVVAEAMSSELPVVATDVGDTRRIVADAGIVVPAGDEAGLADAVRSLAANPALRREMGGAARRRVEAEYALARMVEGFAAAYDAILRGHASTATPAAPGLDCAANPR